jgi:hypothetical protein
MAGMGLVNLNGDDRVLAARCDIASVAILRPGKLIYAVVKVLKYSS